MSIQKKRINRKEVIELIQNKLREGSSRQRIFNELTEEYFNKNSIAGLVASTVDPSVKEQFKISNNLLVGLLGLSAVAKVLFGIALFSSISPVLIPMAILFPFFSVMLALEIYRYNGAVYSVVGLFSIAGILKIFANFNDFGLDGYFDIAIIVVILFLAFYLKEKMFPFYGFLGPKKDKNGNYILE
jgi:multidrug efflux pump subunit AcrB